MRRIALLIALTLVAGLTAAAPAQAAPPTLGTASATNIEGASALLKGEVNPEGLPSTFSFEYVDQAGFEADGFSGATTTPPATAGAGGASQTVTAAISGLSPSTTYHVRLTAQNASGTTIGPEATFATTSGFGFLPEGHGFSVSALAEGGEAATAAGSHPYQLGFKFGFKLAGEFEGQPGVPFSDGDLRELRIDLPAGLIQNASILPRCSTADFHTPRESPFEESLSGESCPEQTQVGVVDVHTSLGGGMTRRFGVFNLAPPPGVPSQIGFAPFGEPIVFDSHVRAGSEGEYALTLEARNFPQWLNVHELEMTLWGTPWGVSHNGERGNCLNEAEPTFPWAKCSVGPPAGFKPLAYLTLPTVCDGPLSFTASASSWEQPGEVSAVAVNRDSEGNPAELDECESLIFDPHPFGRITNKKASSATGFNFQLFNDNEALTLPKFRIPSQAKRVVIELPEGVTINPSVGAGLGVCTPAQYAAETALSPPGAGCPNASKIGDFTVDTPLIEEQIEGGLFLAQPDEAATAAPRAENPFDSLLAVYLVGKAPARGLIVKLAGRLDPDPQTGTLTATFNGLPQLPYSNLEMNFREGQRAPLITPPFCGTHYTHIAMTPWVGEAQTAKATSESHIESGIGGGPCPSGSTPPFSPGAVAGGVNSNVGSYTPYYIHLTREDTEQEITSYSLVLPKGITGKLAGIPFCPEEAIAAARTRRGFAETAEPSCPAASQVGHTVSGYGVGPALTYAPGRVYLAGPYHGQPLSLVVINSATVGPFDLGTIVIRSAFSVQKRTAQLAIDSSASDRIPHILDGIPLHLRDIHIHMDRPQFTLNPTSCEPSQLTSTLTGAGTRFDDPSDDSTATGAVHFQLLNCGTLGYAPKLGMKLRGGTRRGAYPSLQAVVQGRAGDANLKDFAVTMPHSMFLAQNHIRSVCTREQFAAGACPPASVYGSAVAFTPLFDEPLRGFVYLRSSEQRLPDLVASLHSGAVNIVLEGKIGPAAGGIRVAFTNLPDAPLARFVMRLHGGKRGLVVNSANNCKQPPLATARAIGQNNRGAAFKAPLRSNRCKKQRRRKSGRKRSSAKRGLIAIHGARGAKR